MRYFGSIVFALLLVGCTNSQPQLPSNKVEKDNSFENIAEFNRLMVETEIRAIEHYVDSLQEPFHRFDDGLYMYEQNKVSGDSIVKGDVVTIKYKITLFDGTECYNSETDGNKTFVLGTRSVERGLESCISLLHKGSKAKILIPSFLGHGVLGDLDCITPRTPILYELEIIDLKKNE